MAARKTAEAGNGVPPEVQRVARAFDELRDAFVSVLLGRDVRDGVAWWKHRLNRAEQQLLDVFVRHYPTAVPQASAISQAGYQPSGTVNAAMAKLRLLELVDGPRGGPERASDYLMVGS